VAEPKQQRGRSKQDYGTPWAFIEAAQRRLHIGMFAIDLAAHAGNRKASMWISKSSLTSDWGALIGQGWGWLNPPFDNIAPWAKKCAETAADTDAGIAFLVPASVGSNWYRDHVAKAHAHALFLNGRITFEGCTDPYPKDLMLVLYRLGYQGNSVWRWREQAIERAA
jgi:hypothetical protein